MADTYADSLRRAAWYGKIAAKLGLPRDENPYKRFEHRQCWTDGYNEELAAKREREDSSHG